MIHRSAFWLIGAVGLLTAVSPGVAAEIKSNEAFFPIGEYYYSYPWAASANYAYKTRLVLTQVGDAWTADEKMVPCPPFWGSATDEKRNVGPDEGQALKALVSDLGRQLLAHAKEAVIDEYVITMSTFVNLNNLYRTSSLGRYLGEQLISELQEVGIDIFEVRKTPMILMSDLGEYSLSRDMKELDYVHNSQATVVGTYTLSKDRLFVNARLLRNSDGLILSTASQVMDINKVVGGLLADERAPRKPAGKILVRNYQDNVPVVAEKKGRGGQNP